MKLLFVGQKLPDIGNVICYNLYHDYKNIHDIYTFFEENKYLEINPVSLHEYLQIIRPFS